MDNSGFKHFKRSAHILYTSLFPIHQQLTFKENPLLAHGRVSSALFWWRKCEFPLHFNSKVITVNLDGGISD